mmetsp:Transcript_9875/g.28031  ORF Transcript_9875/g.28031 Transcript_9875/m.28031 type:complete len:92 (-) Transcript_9875:426-701(-)
MAVSRPPHGSRLQSTHYNSEAHQASDLPPPTKTTTLSRCAIVIPPHAWTAPSSHKWSKIRQKLQLVRRPNEPETGSGVGGAAGAIRHSEDK